MVSDVVHDFRRLDLQRRLYLTQRVALIAGILFFLLFGFMTAYYLTFPPSNRFLYIGYEILGVCLVLYSIGTVMSFQGRARLAIYCVTIASIMAVVVVYACWVLDRKSLDGMTLAGFATFDLLIVLIGIIGELSLLYLTTGIVAMSTICLILSPFMTRISIDLGTSEWMFLILQGIIQQGLFLLLLWTINHSYHDLLKYIQKQEQNISESRIMSRIIRHEMKTPIFSLLTDLEVLLNPIDPMEITPMERKRMRACVKQIEGQITLTPENEKALQIYRPIDLWLALDHAISVVDISSRVALPPWDSPLIVKSHWLTLRLLFINLLRNAANYSQGIIEVTVDRVLPQGVRSSESLEMSQVQVAIRDQGRGMTRHQLAMLFQQLPGTRGNNVGDIPGEGVGLYACKRYVDWMGGRIWAESKGIGCGSTFFVRLSLADAQEEIHETDE